MSYCAFVFKEFLIPPICMPKRHTLTIFRQYATHHEASNTYSHAGSSSLLSRELDQKQRNFGRKDTVGPFQLGLSQPSYGDRSSKKWSELSPRGKGPSFEPITRQMAL